MENMVLLLALTMVMGLLRLVSVRIATINRINFAKEYTNNYVVFVKKLREYPRQFDEQLFQWLNANVDKMALEMGHHGILDYYSPLYLLPGTTDYWMLPNTLMGIRSDTVSPVMLDHCFDAMVKYHAALSRSLTDTSMSPYNPFAWPREGVRLIVALPFFVIRWAGLDRYSLFQWLSYNGLGRFVTSTVWMFGLCATIIGLVADWGPFEDVVNSWLP